MPDIVAKMLNQTIGGTHVDSQGEKIPKYIFDKIAQAQQIPISQTINYLTN